MMQSPRQAPFEPDVAVALAMMAAARRLPFEAMTVDAARATYRAGRDTVQLAPQPVADVRDIDLGRDRPLPARLYRPDTADASGAILFFHGGGWVIGDLDTHDGICRRLANAAGRVVVAVDYRLAPEHPFPAAVDDAVAAYETLYDRAAMLDLDPTDVAVAGDSAGGGLAAVTVLAARDAGLPVPVAAALFYPVVDLRGETESYRNVRDVPISAATMYWFRDRYLRTASDAADWRCSPLLTPSLIDFPPTFIASAGHDPLCDEAFAFAARLVEAGTPVDHQHLPGQIHGYLTLGRLIGAAERTIDAAGHFFANGISA